MIVVDELVPCLPNRQWRHNQSCHLTCGPGEVDELHAFALSIGLRRSWFQPRKECPHYDLTKGMRAQAVAAGAVQVDRLELVAIMHAWRQSNSETRTVGVPQLELALVNQ